MLAELFDEALFGVLAIAPDGVIEYVNPRQCENSSLPAEAFVGKDYRSTFGPTIEKAGLLERYDRLVANGEPFEATLGEYKRHRDGASIAFTLRGHRAGSWILLTTRIETVLAEQFARYRQLFENANDGIFILSPDGKFVAANAKFAELAGMAGEQLIGQPASMFLPGGGEESRGRMERIMRDGHFGPYALEITTPNGKKIISLNAFALIEGGMHAGVINIARDVTKEHEQTEELRIARDKALESSRLKTAFLANMSHEIRTPLNIILGYNSLLAEELDDRKAEELHWMFEGIKRAGQRLQQTISSILDISKIEAGSFSVNPERVELAPLIARHVSDFMPLAAAKGVGLDHQILEPKAAVNFDAYCLDNALMNLLDNAIKFTNAGEVRVVLRRDVEGRLCLDVRDTGIGMDLSFLEKLSEPFLQEDSSFTRRFEGAGLGLALTRNYLALNHAWLSVESERQRGSIFTIQFTTELSV